MIKAKLILLNGFMAAGKTTIAKKYIANHSLAMTIEADTLVDNIGDWTNHRGEARQLSFELIKAMIRAYLPSGHDIILPYMVTSADEARQYESIARDCSADYYEVVLYNQRSDAIDRLLKRGKWGMETSPSITDKDLPVIQEDFSQMETALKNRPNAIKLSLKGSGPDRTYQQLLELVEQ